MINVLHLISSLNRGGRERQLATLYKYSEVKKVKNIIICFNETENSYVEEYKMENDVFYLSSKNIFKRVIQINRIIKEQKPEIVWTWGGFEASIGLFLCIIYGIKHVNGSIRHGIVSFNRKQLWRMFVLHLSKYRVANSKAGLKANKLKKGYVFYNGLDKSFFEINNSESNKIRKQLHITPERIILISVANLVPSKDYVTVINALYKFKISENNNFHYLIIGEGHQRSFLENLIEEMNLQSNITLLGRRKDVKNILDIAEIFIHSSRGEGCSNAILEAMAAGLPVIATNVGGVPETVFPGSSMLFPYRDHNALYMCLLNIQKLRTSFNPKSKEYIAHLNKFSVETMISRFEEILKSVLADN